MAIFALASRTAFLALYNRKFVLAITGVVIHPENHFVLQIRVLEHLETRPCPTSRGSTEPAAVSSERRSALLATWGGLHNCPRADKVRTVFPGVSWVTGVVFVTFGTAAAAVTADSYNFGFGRPIR